MSRGAQPTASALTQAPKSTDGGVTIRPNVSAGAVLDPGDRISFQYQSARDAAVIVFDIDTQGYVTLLNDDPVQVSARETQSLPGDEAELTEAEHARRVARQARARLN